MPRFSANISMLFREHELLERVRAARRAGFPGFEVQFPYDFAPEDWRAVVRRERMEVALFNIGAGDLTAGGPGLAAVPGREGVFRDAVDLAARYAALLAPKSVNVLPGAPGDDFERERCMATLAANLTHAATVMADLGVRVVVEPVNTRDRPGFFLSNTAEALSVIDWAAHANLALQYDIYHMQIMEGDLSATLERLVERIGHIQFADPPGRNEPGTGEVNFARVFETLDRIGYDGWVGAEYNPSRRTEDTLAWFAPYRGRS
jgi:hydroxypyruvate isomerase